MAGGFLDIVKRRRGDGDYAGDQHGGAAGVSGSGLPTGKPGNFMFATGIECSNPTIDNGRIRRDQLAECGHYDRWREDLHLVRDLGLKVLRYGLPVHKVHLGPGRFDWDFADLVMAEMQRLEITPILDLLHFGVPDWIGDFQNPDLPVLFSDYAAAVAERYPWVRYYTPVNEIYVAAKFSGMEGKWNEQLTSDRAFVTALKHLTAASILANHAIAERRPDCVIVQSESAEYIHEARAIQSPELVLKNKQRFHFTRSALRPPVRIGYAFVLTRQWAHARRVRLVHARRAAGLPGDGQRLLRSERAHHAAGRIDVSG
jgi:hypothetical protein